MKGFRQTNYLAALIAFLLLIPLCSSTYADNLINLVESLEDVFPDHFPCVGDTLKGKDGFNISVQGVEYTNGSGLIQARNGEIFVVIDLYMHNGSKNNRAISSLLQFEIYDNNEFKYNNISLYTTGSRLPEGNLSPGASIKGQISYTIPVDVAYPIYLRFDDGACFYLHDKADFYAMLGSHYRSQAQEMRQSGVKKDEYSGSYYKAIHWGYRTIEARKKDPESRIFFSETVGDAVNVIFNGLVNIGGRSVFLAFSDYLSKQKSDYPNSDWLNFDKLLAVYTDSVASDEIALDRASGFYYLGVLANIPEFALDGLKKLAFEFKESPKISAKVALCCGEVYDFQGNTKLSLVEYNKCLSTYKKWLTADELKDVQESIQEMKK